MEPTLGEIRIFAGNFAPRFWQFCNGQLLSIANNQALFSLIGTTYGGDGRTTFGLPDLRGRIPVGTGQGPGLQEWTLGEIQGTETVTMLSSNLASHTHAATSALSVSSAAGSANSPSSNYFAAAQGRDTVTGQGVQVNVYATAPTGPGPFSEASAQVAVSGSSSPINNIQPTLAINFIIAVEGIFPSRG